MIMILIFFGGELLVIFYDFSASFILFYIFFSIGGMITLRYTVYVSRCANLRDDWLGWDELTGFA